MYALAFLIIGLSLISLVVTDDLQQQAMGRPKFSATPLGITCGSIYDSIKALSDKLYSSSLTEEETKEFVAMDEFARKPGPWTLHFVLSLLL